MNSEGRGTISRMVEVPAIIEFCELLIPVASAKTGVSSRASGVRPFRNMDGIDEYLFSCVCIIVLGRPVLGERGAWG